MPRIYFTVQLNGNRETKATPPVTFSIFDQPGIESVNVYQEIKKGEVVLIKQIPIQKTKPITKRRKLKRDLEKTQSIIGWIKSRLGL